MIILCYVGIGGALGAMARYGVTVGVGKLLGPEFPFGTLLVNVLGSLLMGILVGLGAHHWNMTQEMRTFMAVGVLGGFTTFSAFTMDAVNLMQRQMLPEAMIYIVASVALSVLVLMLGMILTRHFTGAL